ncbi:hypothetical protein, partial [Endozoicomonas acroporae]|uniref:hypothetical protein n=1 Tax=Endozoicomonas acroporae TaxID=1701104 RepID=UPI0019D63D99
QFAAAAVGQPILGQPPNIYQAGQNGQRMNSLQQSTIISQLDLKWYCNYRKTPVFKRFTPSQKAFSRLISFCDDFSRSIPLPQRSAKTAIPRSTSRKTPSSHKD